MAASHPEQVIEAISKCLISAAPVIRNAALVQKIPQGGLIVLRDGTPSLVDPTLGGLGGCYYSHDLEIEVYVQCADPTEQDKAFDKLLQVIGSVLEQDQTLGGLVFGMSYSRPSVEVEAVEGAAAIKHGVITLTVEYATALPLS